MTNAYKIVFECPKGNHPIGLRRKSSLNPLSESAARKLFVREEIHCDDPGCGWHGKVANLKLLQIMPFNWIFSPAT